MNKRANSNAQILLFFLTANMQWHPPPFSYRSIYDRVMWCHYSFARNTLKYLFKLEHKFSELMTSNFFFFFFSHSRWKTRNLRKGCKVSSHQYYQVKLKSKINLTPNATEYILIRLTVYRSFGTDIKEYLSSLYIKRYISLGSFRIRWTAVFLIVLKKKKKTIPRSLKTQIS